MVIKKAKQQLRFPSFQARFFSIDDVYLAKVYHHETIWNLIQLEKPNIRHAIMRREVECLHQLAPELDAHISPILIEKKKDTAIVMKKLPTIAFCDVKIKSSNNVHLSMFSNIAQTVAAFHFQPSYCYSARISLVHFLQRLMRKEFRILEVTFPHEEDLYSRWNTIAQHFIMTHQRTLLDYQKLVGQPIVGHGDIKLSNIACVDDVVHIIDPAPLRLWQMNERRMDAMFLKIELDLLGKHRESREYWSRYDQLYQEALMKKSLTKIQLKKVRDCLHTVDPIAKVYRLIIFYRLAKANGDLSRESLIKEKLQHTFQYIRRLRN